MSIVSNSSVKTFKCDCCEYITNRKLNLTRHKTRHLKKGGDDISEISDNEEQHVNNTKECNLCINYKQIIEIKDSRIAELEQKILLLEKDMKIAVLEAKLECKDTVFDFSHNFIEKQHQIIDSIVQSQNKQIKPRKAAAVEETHEEPVLPTIVSTPAPASAPAPKKRVMTKDDYKMQDYHEVMNPKPKPSSPKPSAKSTNLGKINIEYLNQTLPNAEPLVNLIERVFENDAYFGKSNMSPEQLQKCKMPKNDFFVNHLMKFQDHHLKLSKSKKALMEYQVDLQSKEKFYNSLFIKAFEKQETKSFYYDKKTKQSFFKDIETWKICKNEDIEKIMKKLENRITKVGMWGANMLKAGMIPSMRYGYEKIDSDILNSGRSILNMPRNEKQLLEQLMNEYSYGLFESCDNERQSDIIFKQMKQLFDPKVHHNSTVCVKYEKEKEVCEEDVAKSDDEEE